MSAYQIWYTPRKCEPRLAWRRRHEYLDGETTRCITFFVAIVHQIVLKKERIYGTSHDAWAVEAMLWLGISFVSDAVSMRLDMSWWYPMTAPPGKSDCGVEASHDGPEI